MSADAIYTLGYGNRTMDEFVALVRRYDIAYLLDVRSVPQSVHNPQFSRDELALAVTEAGVKYVYMGEQLGGRPRDPDCYTADGRIDYLRLAATDFYGQGIERLIKAYEGNHRVAVMCTELRPENCHRSKLIGETLHERGMPVLHIDADGETRTQAEVIERVLDKKLRGGQMTLFDEPRPHFASRKAYRDDEEGEEEDA